MPAFLVSSLVLALLALAGCHRPCAPDTSADGAAGGTLLFRSGFEPDTRVDAGDADWGDLVGVDASTGYDWEADLEGAGGLGAFAIQYQGGTEDQRRAAVVDDPEGGGGHALEFVLAEPNVPESKDGPKGRVQANLYGNEGLDAFTIRIRLRLGDGFAAVGDADREVSWLTLFEFWNDAPWIDEDRGFRVTVNLVKPDATPGGGLFLHAHGQRYDGDGWITEWERLGDAWPVPTGEWFGVEVALREGGADDGWFRLRVTDGDGAATELIDVTGATRHPDACDGGGFSEINPFKLYTSAELLDALHDAGHELQVSWDDFELWRGEAP